MPLTAAKIYPKQYHATLGKGLRDLVAFLINDHASITGPGWSIVEAFDSATSSRQIPSTPSGSGALNSFTGTFSWKDDTLTTDDWIVLETNIAGGNPEFQFYIEYATATTLQYIMFPFEDFSTGGGAVSPPTFPDRAVGSTTSVVTHTAFASDGAGWYTAVADEQMLSFIITRGGKTNISWGYVGSVDEAFSNDTRPFVIYDNPSVVIIYDGSGGTYWNRVSPIDNGTVIGTGYWMFPRPGSSPAGLFIDTTFWLPRQPLARPGVVFSGTHNHVAGFLRNVYMGHRGHAYRNILGSKDYICFSDDPTDACIVFPWDGSTEW